MRTLACLSALLLTSAACGDGAAPGADGGVRPPVIARDAGAPDVGPPADWTLIVLPDTQYLAASYPEIFEEQTRWIVEQKEALNIQLVVHVGDIVDDNMDGQWAAAHAALTRLDGVVPYVLAPGNHDLGPGGSAADRSTLMNAYFPLEKFAVLPSYGGAFEADRVENTYHLVPTPTGPWLVLALEFGPRDPVVAWAREVVRAYPEMPCLVVTHAYLYSDDTRYDWARYGAAQLWSPYTYGVASDPEGVNDAEEMFQGFIADSSNVRLVVSGHVLNDGVGQLTSERADGEVVHQLLANFQFETLGGAGFLRVMTFSADGRRVDVRTYSPYLDEHRTSPEHEFSLEL